MKGLRLIPQETNFDFIGHRYFAYALSLVVVFGSLFLVFTKGLNFGIDFTGGTLIEIQTEETPDLAQLRSTLNGLGLGDISLQEFGAPNDILIRLPDQKESDEAVAAREKCLEESAQAESCPPSAQKLAVDKVRESLGGIFGDKVDYRRTEFVGPQVGSELKQQALYAVLFSILGILVYIWFRFEWQFGVAAIAALMHDVIGTLGLFALTGMNFDLSSVAAILMIAGNFKPGNQRYAVTDDCDRADNFTGLACPVAFWRRSDPELCRRPDLRDCHRDTFFHLCCRAAIALYESPA